MLVVENLAPKDGSPIRVVLGRNISFAFLNKRASGGSANAARAAINVPPPVRIMNFDWAEVRKVSIQHPSKPSDPPEAWVLFEVSSWDFTMLAEAEEAEALAGWFPKHAPAVEVLVVRSSVP